MRFDYEWSVKDEFSEHTYSKHGFLLFYQSTYKSKAYEVLI